MDQDQIQSLINMMHKEALADVLKNDRDDRIRLKAAEALARYADRAIAQHALAYALKNNYGFEEIRLKAAEALARYADRAIAQHALAYALKYALKNDSLDNRIRLKAAEALAPYADQAVAQNALAEALKNDSLEAIRLKAAEALAPHAAEDPQINKAMVEAFKSDPVLEVRQVAARAADCSGEDITKVNFSGLSHLPKANNRTTVIPDGWCNPKSGLMGILNAFDKNRATRGDVESTQARFHDVPAKELERFLSQLSIQQRFGLRMMLKGQLPHSDRMNGDWDQPAIQFLPAAESLAIPQLLTDSAAVKKYLSDHHIGLATGDHSNHRDYNGGKALPPTFRGALIREFNGNGLKMPKDLRGSWWNNATAIGADFQGADLSGATLIGVDLSEAELSGVNLSGARLINCKIDGANLSGAIMDCTWIENCTITDSVMYGGVIQDVIVTTSYINNLTLHGTDENPMMIKGLYLSDSVVLDYALMGNCHVQEIEVKGSAVVGQSNDHVPSVELDCCQLSYYADQPPLRGLSKLILPPNGMVVRQIDCDRQVQQMGAIGSSLVLTVVDGNGQSLGDVPVLEHLARVQIGYQSPKANGRQPFTRNPQLPMARQYWPDVVAEDDAARFQQLLQGAGR